MTLLLKTTDYETADRSIFVINKELGWPAIHDGRKSIHNIFKV